ncbi:UDP-N-acetylgalactosamine-undecaprenyl-phosphate N-acetylgalactosaminephosphotransferase [Bacillus sp. MB95]|nr:UDP-N-acetylgalactosamine-undecaprenyl-phosphate N-acetylgalactosaminephosphotransferase [Bacillus sp. MB95]
MLESPKQNEKIKVEEKLVISEDKVYIYMKRLMDIVGSLFGIIILSPVFILVGILVKSEDFKAPILFVQKRVGKNGAVFNMYKFRSMVVNAEKRLEELIELNEASGAMFKMKSDPRVTRIGKIIRKTSIDELPQLFNVLKGEMSLVGPRPPLPREVGMYNEYQYQRLIVTPGCTGLWQVSGRSNIGFDEMVKLDLQYIQQRNLMNDIYIILKTFCVLLGSKDAY